MKVRVRLLGLLPRDIQSYDLAAGLELDMPEGATCGDVAEALRLSPAKAGMFSIGGILKKRDDIVREGDEIHVFMPLAGG